MIRMFNRSTRLEREMIETMRELRSLMSRLEQFAMVWAMKSGSGGGGLDLASILAAFKKPKSRELEDEETT